MERVVFNSGTEMLDYIQSGLDLYGLNSHTYVFCYSDAGSICTYYLEGIDSLIEKANQAGIECISSLLGYGGHIYDDSSSEFYKQGMLTNLGWCSVVYNLDTWCVIDYIKEE